MAASDAGPGTVSRGIREDMERLWQGTTGFTEQGIGQEARLRARWQSFV